MKEKLLVTGSSSFLGWNLCDYAREHYEVHGTVYNNTTNLPDVIDHPVDLTHENEIQALVEEVQPSMIIHNAAYSKPNLCERNPEYSKELNVNATSRIMGIAKKWKLPFAYISTDLVFDGGGIYYREDSKTNPISIYGTHKTESERNILKSYPEAKIFRCPLMYGYSATNNKGYFQGFLNTMKRGEPLHLFIDEYRSQALASDVAHGIVDIMKKSEGGIYHMGGPSRISRYEFGLLMKEVYKLDNTNIIPSLQKDVPAEAPRASDTSLNIEKAIKAGYNPSPPLMGLLKLKSKFMMD